MKKLILILLLILISFILYYAGFYSLTLRKISDFATNISVESNKPILYGRYGCAMGPNYNYEVKEDYPIIVFSRYEPSSRKSYIKFQPFPETEEEFLSWAILGDEDAIKIVDGATIVYDDGYVPKPNKYKYIIKAKNIESVILKRLRTDFCNKTFKQGTIDSAIRVVWEIKTKKYTESPIMTKAYNWIIYVDALTGEIVKTVPSTVADVINKPVPGWDDNFDLEKIEDEYLFSEF